MFHRVFTQISSTFKTFLNKKKEMAQEVIQPLIVGTSDTMNVMNTQTVYSRPRRLVNWNTSIIAVMAMGIIALALFAGLTIPDEHAGKSAHHSRRRLLSVPRPDGQVKVSTRGSAEIKFMLLARHHGYHPFKGSRDAIVRHVPGDLKSVVAFEDGVIAFSFHNGKAVVTTLVPGPNNTFVLANPELSETHASIFLQ